MTRYEIASLCDAREIIKTLTNDYIDKGKYIIIACPVHEKTIGRKDVHKTNCQVTERGAFCYACHTAIKTADLVRIYRPDEPDPYNYIANFYGWEYGDRQAEKERVFFYDRQALREIGFEGKMPEDADSLLRVLSGVKTILEKVKRTYCDVECDEFSTVVELLGDKYDFGVVSEMDREIKRRFEVISELKGVAESYIKYTRWRANVKSMSP